MENCENQFLNLIKQGLNDLILLNELNQNLNKKAENKPKTKTKTKTKTKKTNENSNEIKRLKAELNDLLTILKNGKIEFLFDDKKHEYKFRKQTELKPNEIKYLNKLLKLLNLYETKKAETVKPTFKSKLNAVKLYENKTDLFNIEYSKIFNDDKLINKHLLKTKTENAETIKHAELKKLIPNENQRKLLIEYNKINLIGLNDLNEIENIENENLKARLMDKFINDFKTNLNETNAENIKTLNSYFLKQKPTNETKNLFNFIIDENENFNNTFGNAENYRNENIFNIKRINAEIKQAETFKTINKIGLKKYNKQTETKQNEIQNQFNKYNKLYDLIQRKQTIKNVYTNLINDLKAELNADSELKHFNAVLNRWFINRINKPKQQKTIKQINQLNAELNKVLKLLNINETNETETKHAEILTELNAVKHAFNKTKQAVKKQIFNYFKPTLNELNAVKTFKTKYNQHLTAFNSENTNINQKINRLTEYFKTEYGNQYNEYNEIFKSKHAELKQLNIKRRFNIIKHELIFNLNAELITK